MASLTIVGLVANRTLSPEMAATLAAAAEERRSLLFVAIPRMAGKSTLMRAVLRYAPPRGRRSTNSPPRAPTSAFPVW